MGNIWARINREKRLAKESAQAQFDTYSSSYDDVRDVVLHGWGLIEHDVAPLVALPRPDGLGIYMARTSDYASKQVHERLPLCQAANLQGPSLRLVRWACAMNTVTCGECWNIAGDRPVCGEQLRGQLEIEADEFRNAAIVKDGPHSFYSSVPIYAPHMPVLYLSIETAEVV